MGELPARAELLEIVGHDRGDGHRLDAETFERAAAPLCVLAHHIVGLQATAPGRW